MNKKLFLGIAVMLLFLASVAVEAKKIQYTKNIIAVKKSSISNLKSEKKERQSEVQSSEYKKPVRIQWQDVVTRLRFQKQGTRPFLKIYRFSRSD